MLKGVNDSLDDAKKLVKLLKGIPAKINLIPFNPWPGSQLRMLRLGADREILRIHLQRRLFVAGAHAARARHPRRLRPAQERDREALRARAHGAARDGDDGLTDGCAAPPAAALHPGAARLPGGGDRRRVRDPARLVAFRPRCWSARIPTLRHGDASASLLAGPVLFVMLLLVDVAAGVGRHSDRGSLRDPLVDLPCAQWRDRRPGSAGRLFAAFDQSGEPVTRPHSCSAPASRAALPIGRSRAGARVSGSLFSRRGHCRGPAIGSIRPRKRGSDRHSALRICSSGFACR